MVFSSPDECIEYFRRKMPEAANKAREVCYNSLEEGVSNFYNEYNPRRYLRTGTFGGRVRRGEVVGSGDHYKTESYLDDQYSYLDGTHISGTQVVEAASQGMHGAAGALIAYQGVPLLDTAAARAEEKCVAEIKAVMMA